MPTICSIITASLDEGDSISLLMVEKRLGRRPVRSTINATTDAVDAEFSWVSADGVHETLEIAPSSLASLLAQRKTYGVPVFEAVDDPTVNLLEQTPIAVFR